MDPEDDFLSWSFILSTSFESGEYSQLLPSFTGLVTDIKINSKLHGTLEEHTDYFLTTTLPDTVRAVLNLGYLQAYDKDTATSFLVSVLPLISWAAVRDNFTLTQVLLQILDIKMNIYSKNQIYKSCAPYEEVVKNYHNKDTTIELINFIKENYPIKDDEHDSAVKDDDDASNGENKPQTTEGEKNPNENSTKNTNKISIHHFDVLFYSYCLIEESDIININDISSIVEVTPCFIQYLNSFQTDDRLRELDTTILSRSFQSLMVVLVSYPSQPYNLKLFQPLFQIASRFVESEMLEKQLVGATVLSKAAESDNNKVTSVFQDWISTTTLADFLIERDIHAKLLEALDPVLSKIITPKHLESFWAKAEQVHSTERSTILSIIASSLKKFDENVTLNFINRITSAEQISPELLEFLANVAKSFTSLNIQLSLHIIDTLIAYGEKLPNDDASANGSVAALAIFAPYGQNSQIQRRIIDVCSDRIISNPSKQKFYIQVLKNMVSQTYQYQNDFNKEFSTVLINAISNPGFEKYQNRPELYELLTLLVTKKKYTIDIDMFNTLISFRVDDLLWKFLMEIITKLGLEAYDSNVKDQIYQTAKHIDFKNNSSLIFVQFLQQFILLWNFKIGYVKSEYASTFYDSSRTIPNPYVIHLFPPEKTNLLFKVIFFAKDDNVAAEASAKILHFISKTKDLTTKKVINSLIEVFNKTSNLLAIKNKIKNATKDAKEAPTNEVNHMYIDPLKIVNRGDEIIIGSIKEEPSLTSDGEKKEEVRNEEDVTKKSEEAKNEEVKNEEEVSKTSEEAKNEEEVTKNSEEAKNEEEASKTPEEAKNEDTESVTKDKNENENSNDAEKVSVKSDVIDAETENDEYVSKARILKLILQYIDEDEKNCYIEDYGVSRHKESSETLKKRHPSYDEITINIVFGPQNFKMKTYRFATPDDLKKRISRRFETSNILLYFNNFSLLSYTNLFSADVKDGSTIICKQYQSYEQPGQKMPTMILYEKDFSNTMLEILSKNEPINKTDECIQSLHNLHKIVFTILKRLPSDQTIVSELDNMDLFIKNMSDSLSNTCLFLYRAQILLTNVEKNPDVSTLFAEHGGVKLLSEYLLSHEPPFHGLTVILKIFAHIFNSKSLSSLKIGNNEFDIEEYDEKLIVYILNLFVIYEKRKEIKKALPEGIKIMNDFLKNNSKRTTEIIFKYPDLLGKMIDEVDYDDINIHVPFVHFVIYIDDKVQLFHLCVSKLNKNISDESSDNNFSIDRSVISIIQNTIPYVHNLDDIKIVLDNCWKMMFKYEKTANVIKSKNEEVLPTPLGYEEEIISANANTKSSHNNGLTYECHSSGNQTAQLSGICQIIYSILTQESKLKEEEMKNTSHILDILRLAVSTEIDEVQDNLFKLFGLLIPSVIDKEKYDVIIQNLRDAINEIHTDRWNYKPATFAKSPTGFTGLRNLGSTCYMNSIFQQLFFTFPFTYLIVMSDMKSPLPSPHNQNKNEQNKNVQNEGHQKLKELFTQLLLTKRRCCDTQPFCSSWKGWGKRLINPREQQDANEFLQLLLDQLPSQLNKPFKGEIKNTIEGESESFESSNIEQFYTICLEIKDFKDVEASFDSFIQRVPLKGESQYCISQDHKIDANKYAMIKTAPDILVLQLKRFEYNLTNFERIKVNDRYEFPDKLNIARLMAPETDSNNISTTSSISREYSNNNNNNNSNDDEISSATVSTNVSNNSKYDYELAGVVVHSGNAEGGHYYSIIRINGKWIKFNDIEVTEITQEEFETETFGGQQTNKTASVYNDDFEDSTGASAYLLFYRRINGIYEVDLPAYLYDQCKDKSKEDEVQEEEKKVEADSSKEEAEDEKVETVHVKLSYDHTFDLTYLCDKEIVQKTEEDNKEIVKMQATFGLPMFNFMVNSHQVEDLESLVSYFFNIFCHSSFSQQVSSMQFRLVSFITTTEQWNFCAEYIQKNFKTLIEPIYINCSITEIMECTSQFITSIIANVEPSLSFQFVEELMPTLVYVLNASWRQVPHVSELMKSFVVQGQKHATIALENNWMNKFIDFITLVYDPTQQNELVSLLSSTGAPNTAASSLNYVSSNGSSSNLVQQITRSNVIIQNINLSNVFLILDALFDVNPSKEYERIIKYSNSILQSPSHSSHFINLLKKMSENDVIDIDVFINAITTNKKEIDNDLVFDTIMKFLLATDDPDRVESLINKACPHVNSPHSLSSSTNVIYSANVSATYTATFVHRILNLVKQKNKEVIDFLLKFPQQTIFKFLVSNDKFAREYTEKIIIKIFDKVSKLSDEDREKIVNKNLEDYGEKNNEVVKLKTSKTVSNNNNNDDSHIRIDNLQQINKRKDELSDEDKQSMSDLFCAMVMFIFDLPEDEISQYYEKESDSFTNQDSYLFINFLDVFEWLIVRLNLYHDESSYNAIQMLYKAFASMQNKTDYNMMKCLDIINLFSAETQQQVFKENYNALFNKWNKIQNYELVRMFNLFADYLILYGRPCDAMVVLKHPSIRSVQKELLTAASENDFTAFNTYDTLINKYINNEDALEDEKFTLKQVIFMNTKFLFTGELSNISGLWTPYYTKLIILCFKYMTVSTRKKVMKECVKTLNLKSKYRYSNYVYDTDNSKKFIEACNLINHLISHPESLVHETVPVQKDIYYDEITSKIDLAETDSYHSNFDTTKDEDDPYDDEENKNKKNKMNSSMHSNIDQFYNHTTIINQGLAYDDDEDDFDEDRYQNNNNNTNVLQIKIAENDTNQPVLEDLHIKWERFINNFLSVDSESHLFSCARVFNLMIKAEMKESFEKLKSISDQLNQIKSQINQQNSQERHDDDDDDSDDDDNNFGGGNSPFYYGVEYHLHNQLRMLEVEFRDAKSDLQISTKVFDKLHSMFKQNNNEAQCSKIALLMTDLMFGIMDYRSAKCKFLNNEEVKNEKAIHLVKLNDLYIDSRETVSLLFYQTLYIHFMRASIRSQTQPEQQQQDNDENKIDLSFKEVDNWSSYFVEHTICNFKFNKYTSLIYKRVLSNMQNEKVLDLFKVFCQHTSFSDEINVGSTIYPNYATSRLNDSSDDDMMYNYGRRTWETRPNEESFNKALIFFEAKPILRNNFLSIFPFKFSQITNKAYYREQSYIVELYGPEFQDDDDSQSDSDDNNKNDDDDDKREIAHTHQNISNIINDSDDNADSEDYLDQATKGTVESYSGNEIYSPSSSKDNDIQVTKGSVESYSGNEVFSPSSSKDNDIQVPKGSFESYSGNEIFSPSSSKDNDGQATKGSVESYSGNEIYSPNNSKDDDNSLDSLM